MAGGSDLNPSLTPLHTRAQRFSTNWIRWRLTNRSRPVSGMRNKVPLMGSCMMSKRSVGVLVIVCKLVDV